MPLSIVRRTSHGGNQTPPKGGGTADLPIFVGRSAAIILLLQSALRFAEGADSPILITGEMGSGKTLLARYIHAHSARAAAPVQIVNCGALSELDNALFGHRRGAFTGATHDQRGRLRQSDGGVIVLDDLERLSHRHQDQLHGIIENGWFNPVGEDEAVHVNVRFIATTNKDPDELVESGVLKRDFLSRLNDFELQVPTLADRLDDIPALCEALLQRHLEDLLAKGIRSERELRFDPACWPLIQARHFDDNVRGLNKVIGRFITQVEERSMIMPADIAAVWPGSSVHAIEPGLRTLQAVREDAERLHIAQVWKSDDFNVAGTARHLGITARSLYTKLKRYGITRPD